MHVACTRAQPSAVPAAWVPTTLASIGLLLALAPMGLADEPAAVGTTEAVAVEAITADAPVDVVVVDAPEVEVVVDDTTGLAAELEATMEVVAEEAEKISQEPEELLDLKVGRKDLQVVDIANKISRQAIEVSGDATALSSMSLPSDEKSLLEQIGEAAKLISLIASDIASKEQAKLGAKIFQEASSTLSKPQSVPGNVAQ